MLRTSEKPTIFLFHPRQNDLFHEGEYAYKKHEQILCYDPLYVLNLKYSLEIPEPKRIINDLSNEFDVFFVDTKQFSNSEEGFTQLIKQYDEVSGMYFYSEPTNPLILSEDLKQIKAHSQAISEMNYLIKSSKFYTSTLNSINYGIN